MGERGVSWDASHRPGRGRGDQESNEEYHSKGLADHGDLLLEGEKRLRRPCQAMDSGFWALDEHRSGRVGHYARMAQWRIA